METVVLQIGYKLPTYFACISEALQMCFPPQLHRIKNLLMSKFYQFNHKISKILNQSFSDS